MQIKTDEVLGEIMGMLHGNRAHYTRQQGPLPPAATKPYAQTRDHPGFSPTNYQPRDWQERIITTIKGGKDLFVVARPGAGKTLPMLFYWFEECLGTNPRNLHDSTSTKDYLYQIATADTDDKLNAAMMSYENYRRQLNNELLSNFLKVIMYPDNVPKILMLVPVIALAEDVFVSSLTATLSDYFLQVMDYIDNFVEGDAKVHYHKGKTLKTLEISRLIDNAITLIDTNQVIQRDADLIEYLNDVKNKIIETDLKNEAVLARYVSKLFDVGMQYINPPSLSQAQFDGLGRIQKSIVNALFTRNNIDSLKITKLSAAQDDIMKVIDPSGEVGTLAKRRLELATRYEALIKLAQSGFRKPITYGNNLNLLAQEVRKTEQSYKEKYAEKIKNYIHNRLVGIVTGPTKTRGVEKRPFTVCIYQSAIDLLESTGLHKRSPHDGGLQAVFCDEAHLVMKFEDDRPSQGDYETQSDQIAKNVYYVAKNIRKDTRMVMMTGTLNPKSARSLSDYMNYCFGRKFDVMSDIQDSNMAILNYIPADWLMNEREVIQRTLVNPKTDYNLLVVFGKNKMLNMLDKTIQLLGNSGTSLAAMDKGARTPYKQKSPRFDTRALGLSVDRPHPLSTSAAYGENPQSSKEIQDLVNRGGKPTDIFHPLQKKAVEVGIGFIFRMDDKIPFYEKKHESKYYNDFRIVAKLFSEGRIKTLMVTDAVGVGVNMDVQNIFMTSTTKPDGYGNFEAIKLSNLSQFLNRGGRSRFKEANIYAPEADIPAVREALAAGITDFEERLVVGGKGFSKALCQSKEIFKMMFTSKKKVK